MPASSDKPLAEGAIKPLFRPTFLLRCHDGMISAGDIGFQHDVFENEVPPPAPRAKRSDPSLKGAEQDYIQDLLSRHGGHRRTVADLLGISERTLYRKLRRYGLK